MCPMTRQLSRNLNQGSRWHILMYGISFLSAYYRASCLVLLSGPRSALPPNDRRQQHVLHPHRRLSTPTLWLARRGRVRKRGYWPARGGGRSCSRPWTLWATARGSTCGRRTTWVTPRCTGPSGEGGGVEEEGGSSAPADGYKVGAACVDGGLQGACCARTPSRCGVNPKHHRARACRCCSACPMPTACGASQAESPAS